MKCNPRIRASARFFATIACGGICLAAAAQDNSVTISPAVRVSWASVSEMGYQAESATNLSGTWTAMGGLVEGTGGVVGEYFDAARPAQFFRVQKTVASGINWLEGAWQATTYQASSNSVPFTTVISITNSSRSFGGIYSNSTFFCSANLSILSYSGDEARFYSAVQSGPCLSGTLIIRRVSDTNALYNWYAPQGPAAASSFGVLTKLR